MGKVLHIYGKTKALHHYGNYCKLNRQYYVLCVSDYILYMIWNKLFPLRPIISPGVFTCIFRIVQISLQTFGRQLCSVATKPPPLEPPQWRLQASAWQRSHTPTQPPPPPSLPANHQPPTLAGQFTFSGSLASCIQKGADLSSPDVHSTLWTFRLGSLGFGRLGLSVIRRLIFGRLGFQKWTFGVHFWTIRVFRNGRSGVHFRTFGVWTFFFYSNFVVGLMFKRDNVHLDIAIHQTIPGSKGKFCGATTPNQ